MSLNREIITDVLESEFQRRKRNNSNYSLRSFAHSLSLPPGRLSEILSGKRKPTLSHAQKVAQALHLTSAETNNVFNSSRTDHARRILKEDQFRAIADWWHYAILSLIETDNFISSDVWIANRLGISSYDIKTALERLTRLGLIKKIEGHWKLKQNSVGSTHDVPQAALRKSHQQNIDQAKIALEKIPLEAREFYSITLAIDPKKIPLAKKLIRKYARLIGALLETGQRTEVYNLNIQFVPVTRIEGEK